MSQVVGEVLRRGNQGDIMFTNKAHRRNRKAVFIFAITVAIACSLPSRTNATSLINETNDSKSTSKLYIWQDEAVRSVKLSTGETKKLFTFPYSGTMRSVAYNDQTKGIGYITGDNVTGQTSTLQYRVRGSNNVTTLKTVDETFISNPYFIKPGLSRATWLTPKFLLASGGLWGGCLDTVYRPAQTRKQYEKYCDDLYVAPDRKLYVRAMSNSFLAANGLQTSTSLSGTFKDVNWKTWRGDEEKVFSDRLNMMIAGLEGAAFIGNRQFVTTLQRGIDEQGRIVAEGQVIFSLALIDLDAKRVTILINNMGQKYYNAPRVIGRRVVIHGDKGFIVYNLDTKKYHEYVLPETTKNETPYYLRYLGQTKDSMVVQAAWKDQSGITTLVRMLAFFPKDKSYIDIANMYLNDTFFAGTATQ